MKVVIDYLEEFARGARILRKKYPSFEKDYETFLDELEHYPFSGTPLGKHTYKHRMAIGSKGKGKSGGARIITYTVQQTADETVLITLMTIYDKSEVSNVTDAYLRSLVQMIESSK